jgi:hypothetical protein
MPQPLYLVANYGMNPIHKPTCIPFTHHHSFCGGGGAYDGCASSPHHHQSHHLPVTFKSMAMLMTREINMEDIDLTR